MTANVALRMAVEDRKLVRRLLARAALQGRSDDTEKVIRRPPGVYYAGRSSSPLEVMRPLVHHICDEVRRAVDLTGIGIASA
jgi:adenylate kinase